MDHFVHVLQVVLFAASADVTFAVPVATKVSVVAGDEQIVPDVKLPAVVEKRLDVFLDDQRTELGATRSLSIEQGHQSCCLNDLDAVATISVLSWLDNPYFLR